jgi:hypothetical protein
MADQLGHSLRMALILACIAAVTALTGCAYRLASQQRLRIIAPAPDQYSVRFRLWETRDYAVPPDGKLTLDVPAYRARCGPFIFGIRMGPQSPFAAKTVSIMRRSKVTRQLSLLAISRLPTDSEGYHQLKLK